MLFATVVAGCLRRHGGVARIAASVEVHARGRRRDVVVVPRCPPAPGWQYAPARARTASSRMAGKAAGAVAAQRSGHRGRGLVAGGPTRPAQTREVLAGRRCWSPGSANAGLKQCERNLTVHFMRARRNNVHVWLSSELFGAPTR